ncbi:MAG TPA: MBL fold metallo-hydrolase, partial [Chloroflexota bacterium]
MRVDFVGHATLLIRQGDLALLSDPWWSGPAYRNQWYPYPIPVPERYELARIDAVYVSHSHEDHLHAPTLREFLKLAPDAEAIIPLRPDTQMRDYLRRIGFRRIREVASGTPFTLRKGRTSMQLTLLTHVDDSLLAVQAGGETLLNLNDALHSSRREMIVEYCRILRGRFPKVDYLFCGFGGASYFPNCVHVAGKDDVAVARARERWFLQNFGLIARLVEPRLAFPFAAHFVLPDERNWWISATRLGLEAPSATLRALLPQTAISFEDLNPGDFVESGVVHGSARVTLEPDAVRAAVLDRYPLAPERAALDQQGFDELIGEIRERVASRPVPAGFDAVIVLTDLSEPPSAIRLSASKTGTSVETVDRADVHTLDPQVVMETRSDLVGSTLRSPFGKDLISIGY